MELKIHSCRGIRIGQDLAVRLACSQRSVLLARAGKSDLATAALASPTDNGHPCVCLSASHHISQASGTAPPPGKRQRGRLRAEIIWYIPYP